MSIHILNRWTGETIRTVEGDSLHRADLHGADLYGADLRSASLSNANLRGADLRNADLSGAVLEGADLEGAYLREAKLRDAGLFDASLIGADLCDSDLRDADLRSANLCNADLSFADLRDVMLLGANLSGANLTPFRDDLWVVLSSSPKEVPGLLKAIKEGRIDGSTYEGDCCCLVGTIANCSNKFYQNLPGLEPDASRPIERFFMGIKEGDTPENSQFSALAAEWTEDWLNRMTESFSATKL